jgi:hypothetical protein
MIIIFDGDTLKLLDELEQFSGKSQKLTLDFILENFKILTRKQLEELLNVHENP